MIKCYDDWGQLAPGVAGLPVAPWGLQSLLLYLKNAYGNPPVYVHENGKFFFFVFRHHLRCCRAKIDDQ